VLPLFALANAGLSVTLGDVDWKLATAVLVGLFCGKPIGVMAFSYLATRTGMAARPAGLPWSLVAGGALLTGIGFTMSILIAEVGLAQAEVSSAKLGILGASILSATAGLSALFCLNVWRSRREATRMIGGGL
jgi:NhaA family Na+:H+ antiporter